MAATPAEAGDAAEAAGPGFWQRLTDPLWRLAGGGRQPPAPPVDLPLPVDKLTCKMAARWEFAAPDISFVCVWHLSFGVRMI